jgi:Ankyrin repeats (3 copies)
MVPSSGFQHLCGDICSCVKGNLFVDIFGGVEVFGCSRENVNLSSTSRIREVFMFTPLALLLVGCAGMPTAGTGCKIEQTHCASSVRPKVVVNTDTWNDANNPRRMLARIQSNLDRVAAGQPTWPAPAGEASDPLLKIVDAYSDFLRGDFKSMDATLAGVNAAAAKGRAATIKSFKTSNPFWFNAYAQKELAAYTTQLRFGMHSPSPLVMLYAGLRAVDGTLWGQMDDPSNVENRVTGFLTTSPENGTWLKLPCRTVIGRVPEFEAAAADLKSLGGPVLACPVDGPIDYARDEMLALHPGRLNPHVTPPPAHRPIFIAALPKPPAPDSREAAIEEMGTHPQQAAAILEHYSHVDTLGELDYALFLHAFKPESPARDATIRHLLSEIAKKVKASHRSVSDFAPKPYDGTDASLLNIIRLASITGVANSDSAYYAIPCAILIARPALVPAIGEYFGSNMDNFMPRSGCAENDFTRMGFPTQAVRAFEEASTQADGNFISTSQGSMVYGLAAAQDAANTKMRVDPLFYVNEPVELGSFEYPYQVWGYTSLNNYVVSQHLRKLYRVAHTQLAAYYRKHMHLDREDSVLAAKVALFQSVFGADCGGDVPDISIRQRLLEDATRDEIKRLLDDGDAYASYVDACSKYAGKDPLLLVAVADPAAFPLVLRHEPDINIRNPIGKTALMEAAQFNQLGIVKLLLERHALVNTTTWGDSDPLHGFGTQLGDDARTALMYAAANGSLKLIETLLDAGADPYQADTKGYRAIDYLLGYGPTPPNPHLSNRQRMQAVRWLF